MLGHLKQATIEKLFLIGMWWRILYGLFRFTFGLMLLSVVGSPLLDVFYAVMRHELTDEPGDILVRTVTSVLHQHPFQVTYFLAGYFLFWSILDIILSITMLRKKTWAFPISFVLIGLFIVYEIFRFTHTHSLVLLWIISFDIFLMWIIKREYQKIKQPQVVE